MPSRPSVLICSPIRYRPECPEVLPVFLDALGGLEFLGEQRHFFIIQDDDEPGSDEIVAMLDARPRHDFSRITMTARPDSRLLTGPRRTGETQLNLAYLRSRLFHHWEHATESDYCLMVDSDVVLAPQALARMLSVMAALGPLATVTLQLNNTPFADGEPAGNAMELLPTGWSRAPYATDGSVIEVARAGACTLYPRPASRYRFTFDPTKHNEEHQGLFDRLREDGFRHYLIRDPTLADHRMVRPAWRDARAQVVNEIQGKAP